MLQQENIFAFIMYSCSRRRISSVIVERMCCVDVSTGDPMDVVHSN